MNTPRQIFSPRAMQIPTGTEKLTAVEFMQKCKPSQRLYWSEHQKEFAQLKFKVEKKERVSRKFEEEKKVTKRIAHCTIQPNQFHIYSQPENGFEQSERFAANKINLKKKVANGELSDKTRKRIEHAIQWLLLKSNPKPVFNREQNRTFFFRLNFITVTLPAKQSHSDKQITATCLNNFLNVLRANGLNEYLWRAECQPATGNIHYHITTNVFFHWRDIRKWWNQSVNLLGYVDKFDAKHHHRNPPSTEIRKVKHIRKLAAYLSKYMAKEKHFAPLGELRNFNGKLVQVLYSSQAYKNENAYEKKGKVVGSVIAIDDDSEIKPLRKIEAKLWGCSQSISRCKGFKVSQNSIQWKSIRELTFDSALKKVSGTYVDSYYGNVVSICKKKFVGLYVDLLAHANEITVEEHFADNKILQYL